MSILIQSEMSNLNLHQRLSNSATITDLFPFEIVQKMATLQTLFITRKLEYHSSVMIQGRLRTNLSVNVDLLYLMRVAKSHTLISEGK